MEDPWLKVAHITANQEWSLSTLDLLIVNQLLGPLKGVPEFFGIFYGGKPVFFANEECNGNLARCSDVELSRLKIARSVSMGVSLKPVLL